jgi:predicted dehydrogenase
MRSELVRKNYSRKSAMVASNNLCKILVVGVGSIGERHVRCFQNTGRAAVSICELDAKRRTDIAGRYNIGKAYDDFDTALSEKHDAVVVATPAHIHVPVARRAIEAKCNVLIEKPLSTSLNGLADLAASAANNDCTIAVAYVYRAHPSLAAMRSAICRGELGKPLQIVAVAGQNFAKYRPEYRDTYYSNRATGGGAIQDALTHVMNAGEWLVGPIDRLVADADHRLIDGVTVEDVAHVIARQGDVLASYTLNQFQAPNEVTITVVCQRATARFEFHHHRWRCMLPSDEQWQDHAVSDLERDTLFISQANSFLDAAARVAKPLCDLSDGIQTLRVNIASIKSVESQTWQKVRDV